MAKDRERLESLIAEPKNELGIATTLHLMLMLQITSRATENAFYAGMRNGVTADDPQITSWLANNLYECTLKLKEVPWRDAERS